MHASLLIGEFSQGYSAGMTLLPNTDGPRRGRPADTPYKTKTESWRLKSSCDSD
jgi:hypothetical protein